MLGGGADDWLFTFTREPTADSPAAANTPEAATDMEAAGEAASEPGGAEDVTAEVLGEAASILEAAEELPVGRGAGEAPGGEVKGKNEGREAGKGQRQLWRWGKKYGICLQRTW